ncbi:hypothetical protein [Catenovulum sediminis]|uniref:Uncharacterized protein n=1 Tax=Catenovulum sediminis TaxID=1740262 RepID=A0ABV1RN91_9ALTE
MSYQGYRTGALTAYRVVGHVLHGRNRVNIWLCQCDCSRMIKLTQTDLLKGIIPACKVCRRGPCVVCGEDITNEDYGVKRNTCSDDCFKQNRRNKQNIALQKRAAADPEFHKKHYQAALQRDPEHNKKRYQRKLEKLNKMTPGERQAFLHKEYKASNKWNAAKRAFLKENDPIGYEAYLKKCREAHNKHYKQKKAES